MTVDIRVNLHIAKYIVIQISSQKWEKRHYISSYLVIAKYKIMSMKTHVQNLLKYQFRQEIGIINCLFKIGMGLKGVLCMSKPHMMHGLIYFIFFFKFWIIIYQWMYQEGIYMSML